ncbi:MAG: CusA/CzcA family heavy metal efflux RND transporter [Planctomycetota bacterium]|jgi:cobalt-zinc-cadmium resistance protein CzcA|nr:CusA/CzcA family heavy metal efflux RND transporter [Planctomycetota bacterium]
MFDAIVGWSLRNRLVVLALSALVVVSGLVALAQLPIDAFPDTTPVQVQINTNAPSLNPTEVEQQITFPVEQAIGGLPGLIEVRSISKFGLSQVVAVFEDGVDTYFARQLIGERLQSVEIPEGLPSPGLGPVATGLGEVLHYALTSETASLDELTTLHDWVLRPQLLTVPGVAEVNTWGGHKRQYHVVVDPLRLLEHELTLDDVVDALRSNNENVGGGVIAAAGELHLVHGIGLARSLEEIGGIVVAEFAGIPVRIRDVGDVRLGHQIRRGAVTANGAGEIVLGLGFMLMGKNSHEVTRRLRNRLEEASEMLPDRVHVEVLYDRTELVDRVISTVRRNLLEGALLVIAVLFVFLGNLRAGLIVAAAIPFAMLFSFNAMLRFGISASLLSLGAIDFGLVVDSSVIIVENCVRRLGKEGGTRPTLEVVRDATLEVRKPTMFGELIILIVYLPILLLEGVEGRLFRPMAFTVIFALTGSLVFSLTLIPVLASFGLRKIRGHERDNALVRMVQRIYRPAVRAALRFPRAIVALGLGVVGLGVLLASQLGTAFIPRLYEEAIVINTVRLSGVALDESVRYGLQIERLLMEEFRDEVRDVWSRTGTAQVATDPMGLEVTDVFVTLTPRDRWSRAETQAELTAQMESTLGDMPGMRSIFTQPIEMRVNEMTAGIRADVGVKIFGDDLEVLREKAQEIQSLLESIPGATSVSAEQVTGQPVLEIEVNREELSRHGIPVQHVLDLVKALGEIKVGEIREGQRRFDLVVRLDEAYRSDPMAVRKLRVPTSSGERIPITHLVSIREVQGPSTITREWQKRRVVVQANVADRDLGGFVSAARDRIAEDVDLEPGSFVRFGGQFEHLERASRRLAIIVPVALGAVLFLLYLSTRSVRDALMIATGAPFAAFGGVLALWVRDMPFTISAGVGFVAVVGVSMLNGLVLVSTIRRKIDDEGLELERAVEETRLLRLRAILMTALVAALGFAPMALNTSVGSEVQRPLATVVIGGVLADNVLTLMVLPALYSLFGRRGSGGAAVTDEGNVRSASEA